MIGYVTLGVSDLEAAKSFYQQLLGEMGASTLLEMDRIAFFGKDMANPLATILSVGMMFRYSLDLPAAADSIDKAVAQVLAEGYRTADIAGPNDDVVGCRTMGELVIERL